MPPENLYTYTRLAAPRHIRVVELYRGHASDASVSGRLIERPLEHEETYEALSYVWGPSDKPFRFKTADGDIPITESLHSAFRHLRRDDGTRVIWADAICINQGDADEKAIQVRLMGDIYAGALRTVAFLGNSRPEDARGITAAENLADMGLLEGYAKDPASCPPSFLEYGGDLLALLRRPWFERAWIVQEFILAQDVLFLVGGQEVPVSVLEKAVTFAHWTTIMPVSADTKNRTAVQGKGDDLEALKPIQAMFAARSKRPTAKARGILKAIHEDEECPEAMKRELLATARRGLRLGESLLSLLNTFKWVRCQMPVDRLFSLLSLANDVDDPCFDPDYKSSVEAVNWRYIEGFLKLGFAFRLLAYAGLEEDEVSDVVQPGKSPTWAPNWQSRARKIKEGSWADAAVSRILKADPAHLGFDASTRELVVTGYTIGTMAHVLEPLQHDGRDVADKCEALARVLRSRGHSPYGNDNLKAAVRTAVGNDTQLLKIDGKDVDQLGEDQTLRHSGANFHNLEVCVERRAADHRLGATDRGYACLVPGSTKKGDAIVVALGCPIPFVFRPSPARQSRFMLVGICYVHGIMDSGEVIQDDAAPVREFLIH